jgi:hypothetical protein
MTKWMPIESAPKDGTRIICLWKKSGHVEDATLHPTKENEWTHCLFDGERLNDEPSHWMEFPLLS